MPYDVIAIGNIVADFIAAPVVRHPNWGELIEVESPIGLNIGGNAAIFSVCASAFDLNCALLGMVGADELSGLLQEKLDHAQVDTTNIRVSDSHSTGSTLVVASETGERGFYHHMGANREFSLDDIDFRIFDGSKALLLCSYFIMPGLEGDSARTILATAKKKGLTTFFDVAWNPSGKWLLGDFMDSVDVFMPNADEIMMLTGKETVSAAAAEFLARGVDTVAVKMGDQGCYVATSKGETVRLDGHKVKAVDTTGAGDTFNAGFVYGMLSGWELEDVARFANAAAAISVTKLGGATAAPTRTVIEEVLINTR